MKKNLLRFFSALAIAAVVLSATAGTQVVKKLSGVTAQRAVEQKVQTTGTSKVTKFMEQTARFRTPGKTGDLKAAKKGAAALKKQLKLKEAADMPNIYGLVCYASSWSSEYNPIGIYKLPKSNSENFTEVLVPETIGSYSFVEVDGIGYSTDMFQFWGMTFITVYCFDMESGEEIASYTPADFSAVALDLTTDPTTGKIYGITYNADGSEVQLAEMQYTTESVTTIPIATLDGDWNSIACDNQGQLYAISYSDTSSALNKIDKTTGAVTKIGDTGLVPYYISSSTIDAKTNRMFWTVAPTDGTGFLAEVDLTTGVATPIVQFADDEQVVSLYIPAPAAEPGAPAIAEDVVASFPEGALTGTVSFKAPSTLFDETPATGDLTYEVLFNNAVVASGNTTFGSNVTANITVETAGNYNIVVTTKNEAGVSPKAKLSTFIGKGIPEAPEVSLGYGLGKMTVNWTAVKKSADGGYINPDEVTYTVTRFPDETVVAKDTKITFLSENIAEPDDFTAYYYTVVAKYEEATSEVAKSNIVTLGTIKTPYLEPFNDESALSGYTIIDANGDEYTWMPSDKNSLYIRYNSNMAMDDWLITPPVKLESGKKYVLSFDANGQNSLFTERIEVKMGTANTVEGMTQTLIEPTEIASATPINLRTVITPATTGAYYIGLHGISDADKYYIFVDNLSIVTTDAPGVATDLTVTPDMTGALTAKVSFKAPALNLEDKPLSDITKIELSRGGEVIKTFDNPAVGATLSYDDAVEEAGTYTYSVVAYNAHGNGKAVSESAYIGLDTPAAPENVSIVETATPGEVTVSWSPVTADINGKPLSPADVTYTIAVGGSYGWEPLFENLTGTSHTFQATDGEKQAFVQYAVIAVTDIDNNGTVTEMIPVGPAYEGMTESFSNGTLSYILGVQNIVGKPNWDIYTDATLDLPAQDADNGYLGMQATGENDKSAIFTGKISLAGTVNPSLSFYTYNIIGDDGITDDNVIEVGVREIGAKEYTTLLTKTVAELCGTTDGWGKVMIDLSAYQGKTIQVQISVEPALYIYTLFDNIKIGSTVDNDLKAAGITAPAKVKTGTTYPVDVTITNEGSLDAAAYTVDLFANGKKVETKNMEALATGSRAHAVFECTMHTLATEPVELYAVVNAAVDNVPDNNTTKTVTVTPQVSKLPTPTDLKAETGANGGVLLSWSEPDLEAKFEQVTEDFEEGESFAHEFEGWTFVDGDNSPMGGFQGLAIPGMIAGETLASFFVFDATGDFGSENFAAHSGEKYLATMFRSDDGTIDEWAISPVLEGSAQTVSFYAKSFNATYSEKIRILYSTGSTNTADFVEVMPATTVPGDWTLYTADLPAGAKYFAINSCATGSFMLMVDDVTYTTAGSTADLSLLGYNVYRDGVKLNTAAVEDVTYLDLEGQAQQTYQVTAIYDVNGESAGSNVAGLSGITDITDGLDITTEKGLILVNGADEKLVTVTALDGKLLYSAKGNAKVSVAPGVYVVKADKTVAKVLVK